MKIDRSAHLEPLLDKLVDMNKHSHMKADSLRKENANLLSARAAILQVHSMDFVLQIDTIKRTLQSRQTHFW